MAPPIQLFDNPFCQASDLPYQAPPFDLIKEHHYAPAIEEGIKRYLAEVEQISQSTAEPDFENTFLAMEQSGDMLKRVLSAFYAMTSANTSDGLQAIEAVYSAKLAEMQDAIRLNPILFSRLEKVYSQRDSLVLSAESHRLIEVTFQQYELAGARLSQAARQQLQALNQEAATLSTRFQQQLLTATRDGALAVSRQQDLAGLNKAELAAAAQAAADRGLEHQWMLVLQNTTQQPLLASLSDAVTREALFNASVKRAEKGDENDTRPLIARLAQIRAQQAKLLGFKNYAQWKLADQMAKTPEAAMDFMRRIVPAATARAISEAKDIADVGQRENPHYHISACDWSYYAEQVRKEKFNLTDAQLKPWFELNRVLEEGVFYAAQRLYGLRFNARDDIPVYHSDVHVYEVFDTDGTAIALFYADLFARSNKSGGAWMGNFVDQSTLLGTRPVIYNVANFPRPAAGLPALLSFDDVITLFHEFGHALHGIFASQRYPSLSGTATPRDFVEFPSQFNEHWAEEPTVFSHYARHYQTNEPMPAALIEKIRQSSAFNKGYEMTELLSAALLDMYWHHIDAAESLQDINQFEAAALAQEKIDLPFLPPRYRSSYFQHIWGGGYGAGYYAYLWTQMLADDAYQAIQQQGGLTPENGQRFRQMILSRGNSEDLARLYLNWRGQEATIEPMLKHRGLNIA